MYKFLETNSTVHFSKSENSDPVILLKDSTIKEQQNTLEYCLIFIIRKQKKKECHLVRRGTYISLTKEWVHFFNIYFSLVHDNIIPKLQLTKLSTFHKILEKYCLSSFFIAITKSTTNTSQKDRIYLREACLLKVRFTVSSMTIMSGRLSAGGQASHWSRG